jgi:hypothetical protein
MAKRTADAPTLSLGALLGDFRLLLLLFVGFRVLLLLAYQPLTIGNVERGVSAGGDFQTYYQIASLSDTVGLPLRDWWSEFPPLWSYTSVTLYQLAGRGGNYAAFALLLGAILIAADTGSLILVRKIGTRLYRADTGMALAWVYALLAVPLVFTYWTFEGLVTFSLLLGVWWLLNERDGRAGAVFGIGALLKFTPALALGAAWRYRSARQAAGTTVISLLIFGGVFAPFLLQNAAMTLPSLTAQWSKASYQSVWALLDGNYRTGNFGPLEDRLDPAKAAVLLGNPAVIPGWLRLGAAAALGLWLFARTRRYDDKGLVAFVAATLLIFFLQAQGWSPQWLMQIIPFVLLCFPNRNGILILLVLSGVTFTEYPFLWLRTGDSGGMMTGALVVPYVMLVLARTGLLAGVVVGLYRILRQPRDRDGRAI